MAGDFDFGFAVAVGAGHDQRFAAGAGCWSLEREGDHEMAVLDGDLHGAFPFCLLTVCVD